MIINKTGEASNYLRKLFTLFLIFTFLIAAGALLLRHSMFQKLEGLSGKLRDQSQTQEISNILLDLNGAENDFQQAILYGHTEKLADYKSKLSGTFSKIENILKRYNLDSNSLSVNQRKLGKSFDVKLHISNEVFALKHSFDSLLQITTVKNISGNPSEKLISSYGSISRQKPVSRADTTVTEINDQPEAKKGLFKRIQDAITNKQDKKASVKVVTVNREQQIRDSISRVQYRKQTLSQQQFLKKLNEENSRLAKSNQQLISANLNLVIQLHQLVQELKDAHVVEWEKTRTEILDQYQAAVSDMNNFTGIAIVMVLVFIVLLIIYIRKAGRAEERYILENERAVALAEQKSEMLAIMSHEIRNPLTTITGTIFLLNRSSLTDDQKKKLESINVASGMLMGTVNDVLDVSKIDSQKDGALNIVSFQPVVEIKEAIAAMAFMAEKKNITLKAEYKGDQEAYVKGDPFRLKQIMMNLLSNAVKYTDRGGVLVDVELQAFDGANEVLKVSVIDTGIGIPKDQQAKLFTRYYQQTGEQASRAPDLGSTFASSW
ncbi:multi-sensor hybrid histidine kinase [Pedobacter sp. BAL39]|nr:histidine kinase dimerization/phospho-acceptor domain-containing protein [Pedobacter sp. BAL39]EDM36200.1 multi-sensor hybrid histidine kinase [Pedobacter sp. BAL39]